MSFTVECRRCDSSRVGYLNYTLAVVSRHAALTFSPPDTMDRIIIPGDKLLHLDVYSTGQRIGSHRILLSSEMAAMSVHNHITVVAR